jgi:hypothetical protein
LLGKVKLPVRVEVAVGLKAKLRTQLAPGAIGAKLQVPPLARWKSPVKNHAELKSKGAVPVFFIVTV